MTREQFIEHIDKLLNTIGDCAEELKSLSIGEIAFEPSEKLNNLIDELDDLELQINDTKYRSAKFYELEENIAEKKSEIELLEKEEKEIFDDANSEFEDLLDQIQNWAFGVWDEQYSFWDKIQKM